MINNKNSPKIQKLVKKSESKPNLNNFSKSPIVKTTPSQSSIMMTSPTDIPPGLFPKSISDQEDINMKDLIFNITDDHKTLINKNRKLAQYVIQSSNKISVLNENIKNLETSKNKDKEELLAKLEKISNNYRTFAESHQKFGKVQAENESLKASYELVSKEVVNYEEFIKFTLLDLISNFKRINNFINLNSNCSLNQLQNFVFNIREEMKQSMGNFKLKLFKPTNFDVYFKEFDKISAEFKNPEKKDPYTRPSSSNSNVRRPLTPEMEIQEKSSHSKHHTLEACNMPLPLKNISRISKKNRQKSFDNSANRFMDFMQNKSSNNVQEIDDVRSSLNSNSENKILMSRNGNNNSYINNNHQSITNISYLNRNPDKNLMNSLSLSEGFDLINNNKHKDSIQEEKKNDYLEEKRKVFCKAKIDFHPKRKNELQFRKGDLIEILLINEEGWCQGILNGKRGQFPISYIEKLD
jgi:hypothetical protein